mmetsp:Transcript_173747/g.556846  ORF Transcript_173747/g.556846 Transcript_173747/m.556846 type:complete len:517 (+) Transcript_173747:44-1594(+)
MAVEARGRSRSRRRGRGASEADGGEPPCELPAWCSAPAATVCADLELRRVARQDAASAGRWAPLPLEEGVPMGQRAWLLLGRRQKKLAEGERQPDVELKTAKASRRHAVLFRNWHGQVFLMDIGSAHGTYLGGLRLEPKAPREWRAGVSAHFADRSLEVFELCATAAAARPAAAPGLLWAAAAGAAAAGAGAADAGGAASASSTSPVRGISAIAAAAAGAGRTAQTQAAPLSAAAAASAGAPAVAPLVLAAAAPAPSFAGARRMMRMELGEELLLRPLRPPADGEVAGEARTAEAVQELPLRPLRPPADGEVAGEARKTEAVQARLSSCELEERLQASFSEFFQTGTSSSLQSRSLRYPCPEHGPAWQHSPWSQTSARFDRERPAIVVTHASVSPGSAPQVVVRWHCVNISHSDLWACLTDAPVDVNQPGPEGHLQVDVPLQPSEQDQGEAVIDIREEWALPSRFYVRVYSCKAIDFRGDFLGFEFGATLRPLSVSGDEWSIFPSGRTASSLLVVA